MSNKSKNIIVLIINLFIVISTIIIACIGINEGAGNGQLGENMIGIGYFKAFTVDSNVLLGICSLVTSIFALKNIFMKEEQFPIWLEKFYLIGVTCVTLTFFTVLLFLAPDRAFNGENFFIMYSGDMFFFHLINPILSMLCFCFFFNTKEIKRKSIFLTLIPVFIYSIIYLIMVVFLERWNDFYNFTFGGRYYLIGVIMVIMYVFVYLFGLGLTFVHNKFINE